MVFSVISTLKLLLFCTCLFLLKLIKEQKGGLSSVIGIYIRIEKEQKIKNGKFEQPCQIWILISCSFHLSFSPLWPSDCWRLRLCTDDHTCQQPSHLHLCTPAVAAPATGVHWVWDPAGIPYRASRIDAQLFWRQISHLPFLVWYVCMNYCT